MLDYIEKLHKKSESARRRILYASVLIIMTIIILAWVPIFARRVTQTQENESGKTNTAQAIAPIMVFKDASESFYKDFIADINGAKDIFGNL